MVSLDKTLPYTQAAFLELLQAFEDMINGFTASGTFKSPYEYVVVEDGTDAYGCTAYQVVYGGPDDAGTVDGGDPVAVIQACLDNLTAARTHPERVLIVGNFTIDDTISVPSYTTIDIIGKLYLDDSSDEQMFENSDTTDGNTNIIIRGIGGVLDGNKAGQGGEYAPIRLYGCVDSVVENLEIKNASGMGIYIVESTNNRGENVEVRFNTVRNAVHHGISVDTDYVYVHHNYVDTTDSYDGIQVDTANRVRIHDNFVTGTTRDGIRVMTKTVDYGCFNDVYDNTVVSAGDHGINIEGAAAKVIYDNKVCGNRVHSTTNTGIRNHYAQDTYVANNEVSSCGRYGIEFYDTNCVRGFVEDNKIYDVSGASGRGVMAYQDYVIVNGNKLDTCTYGIEVRGDHCQIVGNTVKSTTHYAVYLNTAQYCLVNANKIYTADRGIHMASSGYNHITDNYLSGCTTEYISGYAATDVIHNNPPFIDEVWKSATMLNGNDSVTDAHGLTDGNSGLNPDCVVVTGSNGETASLYVTKDATNVVITAADGALTGNTTVYYHAKWLPT